MIKSILRFLLLAVLFTALVLSWRYSRTIRKGLPTAPVPTAPDVRPVAAPETPESIAEAQARVNAAAIARYRADVDAATKRHMARLRTMHADFDRGLRERAPARFQKARTAIPRIRSSLVGFKSCSRIVADATKDKMDKGDRLSRRFSRMLDKPFLRPCANAATGIAADTETFIKRLDAESAAFREQLASACAGLPPAVQDSVPVETFRKDVAKIESQLHNYARNAVWTTVAVGAEAVFVRSTIAACRDLVLLAGGKAIAKASASSAAPLVDGPAIIGDIVAVGGFAWTAYDVYKLQKKLPDAFAKSLRGTVDRLEHDTLAEARRLSQLALERHLDAAATLSFAAKQ